MESFQYKVEGSGAKSVLFLSGKIDEDTHLEEAIKTVNEEVVNIDLSGVVALNSYGVRVWIDSFSKFSEKEFVFHKVPPVIINQINMISNFITDNSQIVTYFAPYYCEECDNEEDVLYDAKDVNYEIKEKNCSKCGSELEFDELEDEYFLFLEKLKQKETLISKNVEKTHDIVVAIENRLDFSEKLADQISKVGYSVQTVQLDVKERKQLSKIINENTQLLVCGYKDTDESLKEIEQLKKLYPKLKIIMLTEDKLKKILVEDWIHSFYPDNIITFEYENLDNNLKEINTVIDKILSNDIFGVTRYLSKERVIKEITIKTAKEKQNYINQILEFAQEHNVRSRILTAVEQIADELIMNAIYNAPSDGKGNDKYKMILRSEKIDLVEDEYAMLKYGVDGEKFIISVTDYFGRLTKDKVLGYLHKCFSDTNFRVNKDSGGAGLGLYIIYSKVQQFIINIKPGVKTEVITSFYLDRKSKDSKDKMFHIFIN